MTQTVDPSRYDIAIIGAGFAGSILARILAKHGRSVALIDAVDHPRFAIGESSTPIADKILRRLGEKHGIETFQQLSSYASWQSEHSDLACGLKRGFSYYAHVDEQSYELSTHNSLLVAASASDDVSDTHWYRSEVDEFLFDQAAAEGVTPLSNHRVTAIDPGDWISITLDDQGVIQSRIAVDASGPSCVMAELLDATSLVGSIKTNTRSTFAHFRGLASWSETHSRSDDPFNGDDAAQHHLIRDGWMWMLRFNNDITSVGLTVTANGKPILPLQGQYPSIETMFAQATQCTPAQPRGPIITSRLQRFFDPIAAPNCWMLPTAAVAIDPLHSTGIAHALAGVDRLADLILSDSQATAGTTAQAVAAERYAHDVRFETKFLDSLVAAAYESINDFPRFSIACMLYFVAAIACEEHYDQGDTPSRLFHSSDKTFVSTISECVSQLNRNIPTDTVFAFVREKMKPYNQAGLFDTQANNRYQYTATKN